MKRNKYSQLQLIGFVIVFFLSIFACIKLYRVSQRFVAQTGITPQVIFRLVFTRGVPLQATDNRVNILVLGIAGGTHEGPDLTDTMIVASVSKEKPSVSLLSIPRDMWSEALKDRINSAYHYGEAKRTGGGKVLAKAVIEDVTGLVIHYVVVVDFSQFEQLIDIVDGIDVVVPKAFIDTQYPIAGKENDECGGDIIFACRYETVQFQAGSQHMDGATALIYVRSRHAEGDEGTDFARGLRQQDIIVALKEKIMKIQPWFHPNTAKQLIQVADQATDTDMTIGEQLTMGKYLLSVRSSSISKISIEPMLINPPSWMYGRYVLVPEKDYETIHTFIKKSLEN
jgi:LCP family protein required for cell wall assembly